MVLTSRYSGRISAQADLPMAENTDGWMRLTVKNARITKGKRAEFVYNLNFHKQKTRGSTMVAIIRYSKKGSHENT